VKGYEETLRGLSDGTAKIILQLWAAVERGDLPVSDFPEVAAQIIAVANAQGRAAAEVALAGYLTAATGTVITVATFPVVDDTPRLVKALLTILGSALDTVMQLTRIATAEPLEAAANRFSEAMAEQPMVTGWVRQLEPDACQLCVWWWREGRVWPKDHPMPTHKGCTCHPLPTVAVEIQSTGYTRKLARAAAGNGEKVSA
jgi:hypothetical protein